MAHIWGMCERPKKAMMRDPDGPLPQKQGLISTSHPFHPGPTLSFHNTTKESQISVSILAWILLMEVCQNVEDGAGLTRAWQWDPLNREHWLHKYCGLQGGKQRWSKAILASEVYRKRIELVSADNYPFLQRIRDGRVDLSNDWWLGGGRLAGRALTMH